MQIKELINTHFFAFPHLLGEHLDVGWSILKNLLYVERRSIRRPVRKKYRRNDTEEVH